MSINSWTKIAPPDLKFAEDRIDAPEFGDSYFQPLKVVSSQEHRSTSVQDETRYTFLQGTDLGERFARRVGGQFCVAELGLGSGANLCETFRFWQASVNRPNRLDYLAFEARPFSIQQLQRAEQAHKIDLSPLMQALAVDPHYPVPGISRHCLAPGFWLTLVLGDVQDTLAWFKNSLVDAWYLDGFAPARNQGIWSAETIKAVGRLTRPGGCFATFTAASMVRKELELAGFVVRKTAGFGPKRERLVGQKCGRFENALPSEVQIAGAGIMGSWAGHIAQLAGIKSYLYDPKGRLNGPGSATLVPAIDWRPTLDFARQGRLAFTSFVWASRAYQQYFPDACHLGPMTALERRIWPSFSKWGFPDPIPTDDVWSTGERLYAVPGTLILNRDALCFLGEIQLEKLDNFTQANLVAVGHVGPGVNSTIRGQQSLYSCFDPLPERALKCGKLGGGTGEKQFFIGSSFEREHGPDWHCPQAKDDHEALEAFGKAARLPNLGSEPVRQWSGLRAVSVDRFPNYFKQTALPWSIGALGSHGFTLAPLLAEQWLSDLVGAPNVIDVDLLASMERR